MSSAGLIIDANLLLLLVIGLVEDGKHISKSNRLGNYSLEDYKIVALYMGRFKNVFITPYIATEVSNLIDLKGEVRARVFEAAKLLFSEFKQIETRIVDDMNSPYFHIFGLTDNSLIHLVSDYTVLTDDGPISGILYSVNGDNVVELAVARTIIQNSMR
ncbi:hypothetical protein [Pseudomonas sp. PE-S1G-1]|uniref:hypothetical protein n=1 Tax=Pseudomonas sp. PE-S1G-1 TaxID=1986995 RepID=UPI000B3FFDDD|nr:hypothetical protein [Pseudomonas sp. PE-S1G-1]